MTAVATSYRHRTTGSRCLPLRNTVAAQDIATFCAAGGVVRVGRPDVCAHVGKCLAGDRLAGDRRRHGAGSRLLAARHAGAPLGPYGAAMVSHRPCSRTAGAGGRHLRRTDAHILRTHSASSGVVCSTNAGVENIASAGCAGGIIHKQERVRTISVVSPWNR